MAFFSSQEYFRIMGVADWILWLSWFIFYFIFYSIISAILAVATTPLLADTSVMLITVLFLLTSLCSLSYSFVATRIFSNSNTAASVAVALYFIMSLIFAVIELSGNLVQPYLKYLAMLFYPVGLSYGTTILLAYTMSAQTNTLRGLKFLELRYEKQNAHSII